MPATATDDQRAGAAHETGARCDGDEARHGAGGGAERGAVAGRQLLDDQPAEHRGGGREVGVDEGLGGDAVGAERRAGVEPEPAEPQDPGADHRQRQVVRGHRLVAVTTPVADHGDDGEGGDAGVDVDRRAAREVERARA